MNLKWLKFFKKNNTGKSASSKKVQFKVGIHQPADMLRNPDCIKQAMPVLKIHPEKNDENINPDLCEKCGACCAFFIVTFPSIEKDSIIGGCVPSFMTLVLNNSESYMKGTKIGRHRCVALEGTIGSSVKCTIYSNRPSTCRNFNRSWEKNIGNTLCGKARAVYGLQPFSQY